MFYQRGVVICYHKKQQDVNRKEYCKKCVFEKSKKSCTVSIVSPLLDLLLNLEPNITWLLLSTSPSVAASSPQHFCNQHTNVTQQFYTY